MPDASAPSLTSLHHPVSIVVCTLDRAAHLRRLLERLREIECPDFEVVVVNGPSADDTGAVLDAFAGAIKVATCPRRNLSLSRNLGIAAAAGELVVFIDDDALPATRDWLRDLVTPLLRDPRLGGVGGPVLRGDGQEWEFEGRVSSDYGILLQPLEAAARGLPADDPRWVPCVQGNNCAFRREVLVAIGGFDEIYTYYLDETDVCLRSARAGRPIRFEPRSVVRHYAAAATYRRSSEDRNWDVMARSEAYFCLKNGTGSLPRRLAGALRSARAKWPYQQINEFHRQGRYGASRRLRYLARWGRGLAAGVWLGLTRRRRTPLSPDMPPPPPFLPFRPT